MSTERRLRGSVSDCVREKERERTMAEQIARRSRGALIVVGRAERNGVNDGEI